MIKIKIKFELKSNKAQRNIALKAIESKSFAKISAICDVKLLVESNTEEGKAKALPASIKIIIVSPKALVVANKKPWANWCVEFFITKEKKNCSLLKERFKQSFIYFCSKLLKIFKKIKAIVGIKSKDKTTLATKIDKVELGLKWLIKGTKINNAEKAYITVGTVAIKSILFSKKNLSSFDFVKNIVLAKQKEKIKPKIRAIKLINKDPNKGTKSPYFSSSIDQVRVKKAFISSKEKSSTHK